MMGIAALEAPNLLILDEPTNHLDIDSREALVHALNEYEGAVILISHDRHLIEACADRLWLVANRTAAPFEGDIEDYRNMVLGRSDGQEPAPLKTQKQGSSKDQRREAAERREASAPSGKRSRIANV
jgi:ATP-binding cassette subfamily F protein 3